MPLSYLWAYTEVWKFATYLMSTLSISEFSVGIVVIISAPRWKQNTIRVSDKMQRKQDKVIKHNHVYKPFVITVRFNVR